MAREIELHHHLTLDTYESVGPLEFAGRNAQHRVQDEFLVFAEVGRWLEVLSATVAERWSSEPATIS
jgi:hypothetical protein